LGFTNPAPSISIHPVFLQTEHPFPWHSVHEMSTSIPGSTKGK